MIRHHRNHGNYCKVFELSIGTKYNWNGKFFFIQFQVVENIKNLMWLSAILPRCYKCDLEVAKNRQ